jgi:sigma-B regulation protein RsbU (phosphoserine phosphatase)
VLTMANSGLPYPIRCTPESCAQLELPGVPLGSFLGSTYDELTLPIKGGDVYVFCSDGIFEAFDAQGREFGATRLIEVIERSRDLTARQTVDAIAAAVRAFRGDAPQSDDMTAVVVRFTT